VVVALITPKTKTKVFRAFQNLHFIARRGERCQRFSLYKKILFLTNNPAGGKKVRCVGSSGQCWTCKTIPAAQSYGRPPKLLPRGRQGRIKKEGSFPVVDRARTGTRGAGCLLISARAFPRAFRADCIIQATLRTGGGEVPRFLASPPKRCVTSPAS
jgi:hypothetical protein